MKPRAFLVVGGQTLVFVLAPRATRSTLLFRQEQSRVVSDALEQRVAGVIQAYDAQGNHRAGTEVDNASAEWLAERVRQLGAEPSLEPFTLSRVDPQSCYLRIGDRRIDGVPMFDGGFTDGEGVRGRLGPVGGTAEIGLLEIGPFKLAEPRAEHQGPIAVARRGAHKAVVLLTRGRRPGLFLSNALAFRNPSGPPMLQVSGAESEWLKEQGLRGAEATVVAQVKRTAAQAFNVTAKIAGSDPKLAPLVFMAPRSAWWQCVSEQGCRLACWLETMRVLMAGKPLRDCFLVALSGHELGNLGMDAYIQRRPDLIKRTHAWIFFGSSIGAPRQPNLIHASDDALEQWTVAAMEKEGLTVNGKAHHDSPARGEASAVQQGGGRFVTVACDSEVYHSVADRWPEAVDVAALARYAKAFANGARTAERSGLHRDNSPILFPCLFMNEAYGRFSEDLPESPLGNLCAGRPLVNWEINMRALFVIFLVISSPVFGADADSLVGTWKLVSWQVIVENEPPQNLFGSHPKGFLILTREGRSFVLTTAENRRKGMGDAERAALHKSMLSYTGKYRIDGNYLITVVDVSWNEEWNGTEQRRHFRIEGNKLIIESAPAPSILFQGKTDFRRIVWEREK